MLQQPDRKRVKNEKSVLQKTVPEQCDSTRNELKKQASNKLRQ